MIARKLPADVRTDLQRFLTNYSQPPEWPAKTMRERRDVDTSATWSTFIGTVVTAAGADDEGEGRRKWRDTDPNHSTRIPHALSNRPESFIPSSLPRVAVNTVTRCLVSGSSRSLNPLLFALLPEGWKAIDRRDKGIASSAVLFKERAVPLAASNAWDMQMCELQQVMMDSANRIWGGLENLHHNDLDQGGRHFYDAGYVLMHWASEIEARRRAAGRNNDIMLRRRYELTRAISMSSVEDQMYMMAKRDQARNDFFRKGGSGTGTMPGPHYASGTLPAAAWGSYPTQAQPSSQYPDHSTIIPYTSTSTTYPSTLETTALPNPYPLQPVLQTAGEVPQLWYGGRLRGKRKWKGQGAAGTAAQAVGTAGTAQTFTPQQSGWGRGNTTWNQGRAWRGFRGAYRGRGRGRGVWSQIQQQTQQQQGTGIGLLAGTGATNTAPLGGQ
jgi:hypothetical protein